jgi:hypothetical protein
LLVSGLLAGDDFAAFRTALDDVPGLRIAHAWLTFFAFYSIMALLITVGSRKNLEAQETRSLRV